MMLFLNACALTGHVTDSACLKFNPLYVTQEKEETAIEKILHLVEKGEILTPAVLKGILTEQDILTANTARSIYEHNETWKELCIKQYRKRYLLK
jgi:hypothetical protein